MSYKTNLNTTVVDSTTQKEIPIERARLKAQLDDFATFQWRGHHMFDDFGCFIINEQKGSLKFYNGPSFTNQYAKTQFSSSTNALLGVDFKQQTIPMKVGLYWFTIEEYQEFLECIGPYQVNYITFDFDDEYGYLVKSGKIADSVKYAIGTDENGKKRYYTELDLTWEVLGDPCVRSNLAYEYYSTIDSDSTECIWTTKYPSSYSESEKAGKFVGDMTDASLLDTPLVFEIPCYFTNSTASLKLEAILDATTITKTIIKAGEESTSSATLESQTITLFDLELQNLTAASEEDEESSLYQLYLRYDSETGLVYIQSGSQTSWYLLNYQTDNTNGELLLKSFNILKWKAPGKFTLKDRSTTEWNFKLSYTGIDLTKIDNIQRNQAITMYSRKNVV